MAAAAAGLVVVLGGGLTGARVGDARPADVLARAPRWEVLHPTPSALPPVRVVEDRGAADWTSASVVNAAFDPLAGP